MVRHVNSLEMSLQSAQEAAPGGRGVCDQVNCHTHAQYGFKKIKLAEEKQAKTKQAPTKFQLPLPDFQTTGSLDLIY